MSLPPAKPLKRGKTPEQYAADVAAYNAAMRAYFGEAAKAKREKFQSLGIKQYEWLAMDLHGCCHVAAKNGGKLFSVIDPPPEGHVGEGECSSPDWCRCSAAPKVEFGYRQRKRGAPSRRHPFNQNNLVKTASHEANAGKLNPKAMRNTVPFDWLASIASRRVMPCLSFYLAPGPFL